MSQELNLWDRLQGETPKFFKRVRKWALGASASALSVLSAPLVIDIQLDPLVVRICKILVVAGIAAGATSSTAVKSPPAPPDTPEGKE